MEQTMETHQLVQGSHEWRLARVGSVGASRISDIIAKTKTGYSTSRANYAAELVCERLTGVAAEHYQNAAMAWGTEKEPEARAAYEFMRNVDVQVVGLVKHPHITGTHASPDGLVGDDGLIEIKAPISATHIDTLLSGKIPDKYVVQMLWQMSATGRLWCDYVSFDPRCPAHLQLFIKRLHRDEKRIGELEREVESFLAEVDDTIAKLAALAPKAEAA
jgi:putative phage-type endonuclease